MSLDTTFLRFIPELRWQVYIVSIPQIRNCCDKMPVWLIPIILLSLAVMMVSYFS